MLYSTHYGCKHQEEAIPGPDSQTGWNKEIICLQWPCQVFSVCLGKQGAAMTCRFLQLMLHFSRLCLNWLHKLVLVQLSHLLGPNHLVSVGKRNISFEIFSFSKEQQIERFAALNNFTFDFL